MTPWSINASFTRCVWLLTVMLLFSCGQQATQSSAPVEISRATSCSLDGMTLADYPGPKAQIIYAGQSKPEYFCDLMELFDTILKPEQARKIVAMYVQDMGKTEWETPQGHWIDAKGAFYVIGSNKMGSMGPTFGAFSSEADARKFVSANGGKVYKYDEVTPDMASLDGGALHDQQM